MLAARRGTPTVILLMGVSGSGKSTTGRNLSRLLGWPFSDADDFHPPENIRKMKSGRPLDDSDREPWLAAIASYIDERRRAGKPAIVSCSALKRRYRQALIAGKPDVALVFLSGTKAIIGERLSRRKGHFMPPSLLDSQFAALETPEPDEGPLVVSIALSPRRVVETITQGLGLGSALQNRAR